VKITYLTTTSKRKTIWMSGFDFELTTNQSLFRKAIKVSSQLILTLVI